MGNQYIDFVNGEVRTELLEYIVTHINDDGYISDTSQYQQYDDVVICEDQISFTSTYEDCCTYINIVKKPDQRWFATVKKQFQQSDVECYPGSYLNSNNVILTLIANNTINLGRRLLAEFKHYKLKLQQGDKLISYINVEDNQHNIVGRLDINSLKNATTYQQLRFIGNDVDDQLKREVFQWGNQQYCPQCLNRDLALYLADVQWYNRINNSRFLPNEINN